MAENKKGFIMYADQRAQFDQLTNEQAGKLIKHLFAYVNDEQPTTKDALINMAFTPIKQQLKRDLEHWESVRKKRSKAGSWDRKKKPTKPTNVKPVKQKKQAFFIKDILLPPRLEHFDAWILYRQEIKKPIENGSTLTALAKRFNSEPLAKIEWVVNRSIENKWQGLRWEDYAENKEKKSSLVNNVTAQIQ